MSRSKKLLNLALAEGSQSFHANESSKYHPLYHGLKTKNIPLNNNNSSDDE